MSRTSAEGPRTVARDGVAGEDHRDLGLAPAVIATA
jgi:hypothetical protein